MHESFRIRFRSAGAPWPFEMVPGGVRFDGEASAFPRRMFFEFDGHGEATKTRMRFVQTREGWHPYQFPLTLSADGGGLRISGFEPDTMPPGLYTCRIVIDDVVAANQGRFRVEVSEGRTAEVEIEASADPRRVTVKKPIPAALLRIFESSRSMVDGVPLLAWLDAAAPRASRKACLLNILAKAAATVGDPLLSSLQSIFCADVDRVYAEVTTDCAALMERLADDPRQPFYREGTPKAAVHQKLLDAGGVDKDHYHLRSYRQEGKNCLQVVTGTPKSGSGRCFAEFDIDLGNALQDVAGFFVHMGELANPGRTDHFRMRDKLLPKCGSWLCYDIVTPHIETRIIG